MLKPSQNNLNYRVIGNGRPVVFLHGFLESMTMWEHLSFSNNIQQILIDLPGHGASDCNPEELSMASVAKDVKIILDDLDLQEYQIVGHSMGGYVGLELKKIDARCKKLILLHSNFWQDSLQKKNDRLRVSKVVRKNKKIFIYEAIPNLFLNPQKNDKEIKSLIDEAIQIDAEVIAKYSIAMSERNDNTLFIQENKEDVLIVQGAEDAIVSCQKMKVSISIVGMKMIEINDCGHMGHIEKPEEINRILKRHLVKN